MATLFMFVSIIARYESAQLKTANKTYTSRYVLGALSALAETPRPLRGRVIG
jgi:hypothetical protein